jgi:hypothetical protein
MKAYIMLIMLLQMDPDNGLPYTTAMQQSPVIEYSTLLSVSRIRTETNCHVKKLSEVILT